MIFIDRLQFLPEELFNQGNLTNQDCLDLFFDPIENVSHNKKHYQLAGIWTSDWFAHHIGEDNTKLFYV